MRTSIRRLPTNKLAMLSACAALGLAPLACAQAAGNETQRNVNQQQRIEQGLESGQLDTREAAHLEHGEARVNRLEANAMRNGSVSSAEAARIGKAQKADSARIYRQKHDAQEGNATSASSRRMQADVQRNVDQQARIRQGVASGSLTTAETAHLERGQAHVARKEARDGSDGRLGAGEQVAVQRGENVQSRHIFRRKHD